MIYLFIFFTAMLMGSFWFFLVIPKKREFDRRLQSLRYKEHTQELQNNIAQTLVGVSLDRVVINALKDTYSRGTIEDKKNYMISLIGNAKNDSQRIVDVVSKHFKVDIFIGWAAYVVGVMEEFEFELQPSVNREKLYASQGVNGKHANREALLDVFEKVNLLEHTANVMEEFGKYIEKAENAPDRQDMIAIHAVGMACLMHDMGKSISLAKHYELFEEGMENGAYRHEVISAKLVDKMAHGLKTIEKQYQGFEENEREVKLDSSHMVETIKDLVLGHHKKKYETGASHHLQHHVNICDGNARDEEVKAYERAREEESRDETRSKYRKP